MPTANPPLSASPAANPGTATAAPIERLLQAADRIAHQIPGNSPERNLVKLAEETGELARTWTRQLPREAVIEEACDVVITALVAAAFARATTAEIEAMLEHKLARALARCTPPDSTPE
ncbi:MAG: hypothetical protein FGM40_06485 [Rhodocyclaceae bacterium]|nr:hypothetical protein [Rhodocyclaceae bacterium]